MGEKSDLRYAEFLALANDEFVIEVVNRCRKEGLIEGAVAYDRNDNVDAHLEPVVRIENVLTFIRGRIPTDYKKTVLNSDLKKHIKNVEEGPSLYVIASLLTAEALKIMLCPPYAAKK